MEKKNKSLCPMPWSHVKMNVQGHITPCCVFDIGKSPDDMPPLPLIRDGVQAGMKSEYMERIRERMNSGERLPECERCYLAEENGVDSHRLTWKRFDEFINTEPKVRFLETAFSTHCNMACRMCGEAFSSKWKLINNPGMSPDTTIDNDSLDYYDGDLSELKLIKLVGGEPLLDKKHEPFLKMLFDKSDKPEDIILYYNTNGTIKPKQPVLDFWKKAKKVILVFSIDGIGELNEILRPPHDWKTISDNVDYFKTLEGINFEFRMHTVISVANIKHLMPLVQYSMTNFNQMPEFDLLTHPEHLSLQNIDYKDEVTDFIYNNYSHVTDKLSYVTDFINQPSDKSYSKEDICNAETKITKYFKTNGISNLL